jgi:aldose 1-epimerase
MFHINKEKLGNLDAIEIKNDILGIEVQIIQSFGALINKLSVNHSPFSFISGYKDYNDLIEQHPFFSRSAKLFPFPNRLEQGQYSFLGTDYQLPANFPWSEHAVHGLLYNQAFDVISTQVNDDSAGVTLRFSTESLHSGYPFAFQIDVAYLIDLKGVLSCSTTLTNLGSHPLPFGDAWHPYFTLGCPLEDMFITMPRCQQLELVNDFPTGQSHVFDEFAKPTSLAYQTLNHCFEFNSKEPIRLLLERSDRTATLEYQQDPSYRFMQLYTPPSEPSLAVEPMTCPTDAFNNQIGLLTLQPTQSSTFSWQCHAKYTAQ